MPCQIIPFKVNLCQPMIQKICKQFVNKKLLKHIKIFNDELQNYEKTYRWFLNCIPIVETINVCIIEIIINVRQVIFNSYLGFRVIFTFPKITRIKLDHSGLFQF